MACPDGCGETLTINLDPRAGKAWRADGREGRLTLYPSVWRDQGCRSHFILWRDRIVWCDVYDPVPWADDELVRKVRRELELSAGRYVHFETIAAILNCIPWEALWACQRLQREKKAEVRNQSEFRVPRPTNGRRGWTA
jgi:hypothetical protein